MGIDMDIYIRKMGLKNTKASGGKTHGWKTDIWIWCMCLRLASYPVTPTSGAFCRGHKFSLTFPPNPVAPQGFTDILKGEKMVISITNDPCNSDKISLKNLREKQLI